ncbi:MAG TPA: pitrilysin family protein, partial [Kofleriaceae bacterium]|nr:pitrilysin family protein [Kofleriaceae bacterium]
CRTASGRSPSAAPATPPPPAHATQVRTFEGITEYALPNGLRVLLFPDPTQSTVTVNITYFVGSKLEGAGETGMAHLLEHMMFKGSPDHRNVLKLMDERGAFANGTTWQDRTNYYETLPAAGDNLPWALALEADRMRHASISDDDLSTEFSVVRNEMESGENDPRTILEQRVTATAYIWHNYGKDTIGSRSDVEHVPASRLHVFYDRYYQPDNAMLVIAGKFDAPAALAEVEARFGAIPKPDRVLPPSYTVEPVQDGERSVTLRRTGDVYLAMALYHGVAGADPDHEALDAVGDLLTREPTGRLYKALVVKGLAADVWSSQYLFRDPSYLIIGVKAKDASTIAKCKDVMLATIEGLATSPVTAEEVDRYKASALKELSLSLADSQRIAVELSEWAAVGDWRLIFAHRARLKALTAADVQRAAKAYLRASNRTLGEFIPTPAPDRAAVAPTPDVASIVDKLVPEAADEGEVFETSLDNLGKRTAYRKLAGGLEAAFLAKKTRGHKVYLRLELHHGDAKALTGKAIVAELVGATVERGTTTRSYSQIEDLEDKLTANVRITSGPGDVSVRIETVRESLPQVIELVADMLEHPAFDDKELAVAREQEISSAEEDLQDPTQLAFVRIGQLLQPWPAGDPREHMSYADRIAQLKKVTSKDLRAYHAAFWGAGHGEVSAVGDFDPDELSRDLEKQLGGWISKAPYTRLEDKAFAAPGKEEVIDTRDKEMAIVLAAHDLTVKDDSPDAPAMTLASQILAGTSGSRMWMRLREHEGLSYGVWGGIFPGDEDPVGEVTVGAILAPQNLARGKAAMVEELDKAVAQGVTADEIETARKGWIDQQDNLLADDSSLANVLVHDRKLGRDFGWYVAERAKLAKVSADDVTRVLKTYLEPSRLVFVLAGDQVKAKPQPDPNQK